MDIVKDFSANVCCFSELLLCFTRLSRLFQGLTDKFLDVSNLRVIFAAKTWVFARDFESISRVWLQGNSRVHTV
jgi:hypothetical protein